MHGWPTPTCLGPNGYVVVVVVVVVLCVVGPGSIGTAWCPVVRRSHNGAKLLPVAPSFLCMQVMGKLKDFFPISEVWYIWYAVQILPHSLSPFPLPFFWFTLLDQCRLFDAFCDRLRLLLCLGCRVIICTCLFQFIHYKLDYIIWGGKQTSL